MTAAGARWDVGEGIRGAGRVSLNRAAEGLRVRVSGVGIAIILPFLAVTVAVGNLNGEPSCFVLRGVRGVRGSSVASAMTTSCFCP